MNSETKTCQNCKQSFIIEPEDFDFYVKIKVPAPTFCPDCRFRRRAAFRNEQTLYKSTCGLCKKSIVTMHHPNAPYPVYCFDCWASDKWDPLAYGMDYNTSRPFFDQLYELTRKVPKAALYSSPALGPNINSEYANFAGGNKDCYLVFNTGPKCENCAYARGLMESRDTFDAYFGERIERGYELVNVQDSAGVCWGQNVFDSLDSYFLLNCTGCTNCFGCVNLRHKSYHFFNEPLSKEEYEQRVGRILGSHEKTEETRKRFEAFVLSFPRKENNNFKSPGSIGEYIIESKNAVHCFEVGRCEDVKYGFALKLSKDCYDILGHGRKAELLLEGVGVGIGRRIIGGWWVESAHDVEYSFGVRGGAYCFGCDGLHGPEYCILNKRYTPEEYHKLRAHIIEELKREDSYGVFFPPQLSFFGYNETVGQDNMPLTEEEARTLGFLWQKDIPRTSGQQTLEPAHIPDYIEDVPESILQEVLACIDCNNNYRLIPAELEFYKRMRLPIPRRCFTCRHKDRIRRRGPFTIFDRTCAKCGKSIKTSYAPDRPEIVYCEACYQAEVV